MGKTVKSLLIAAVVIGVSFLIPPAGIAIGTATITSGAILAAGVTMALSTVAMAAFGPKMPKTQMSRLNVSLDPSTPRKAVFGTTAMPLDLRYHESSGTNQEYVDYIIAVAAHKVASITEIWFEEKQAWTLAGGVTGTYSGYLTVAVRTEGTAGNYISINGGTKWGSSRRLTGCAYLHLRIKRTGNDKKAESPLVGGLPSRVTVIGDGALLYDPRKDSTVPGGSGSHRATDQSTWGAYTNADDTDNPALQLLWWLLGWEINSKLSVGCGVPYTRIDMESFITAANTCDENVTLAIGGTQKRYRTSGTASDADDRMEIINNLLASMNGTLRDNGGKLTVTAMKNDLADYVLTFNESDMLGEFDWQQTRGLTENYNIARGRYVDPSANSLYQMVDYPEVGFAAPDGIERVMSLDLPYVEDGRRAQRIAKQVLQRNQYRGMFSTTFNAKALGCQVGDVVRVSLEALGWSNKLFRVVSQEIRFDGQVPMALVEENAAIYAWDADDVAPITPTAPTIYNPLNSPFILGIAEAEAIADGKIESFYQATMPTTGSVGDLWIDTDDGNKLYRHNGITFIEVQDDGISTAIAAASDAQATADGKVTTFYIETTPTAEGIGDLWYKPSTGYLTRWNGSSWVDVANVGATAAQVTLIGTALSNAANAQATADGKIDSFYQTTMPTGTIGDIWFDTDDGNKQYRHNGTTFVVVQDTAIGTAITAAAGAQATADGKVTTFASTSAPTAEGVGDLWVDTDDSNKLYRWSGSAWVSVRDAGIAAAAALANDAQVTADGKVQTFYQSSAPTAEGTGDLWFDTDDGNKQYRWSGSAWVAVQDAGIGQAISDAAGAQATADGKVTTFYTTTAPTAEGVGDLWFDTDDSNKLYRWSGSAWVAARDAGIAQAITDASTAQTTANSKVKTFTGETAPTADTVGDLWFKPSTGYLTRWNGSAWVDVSNIGATAAQITSISTALSDAANAQTTADGKVQTFYQASPPTAEGVGDLWFDTDDGNKQYRWSGSTWVAVQDAGIGIAISDAAGAQATADGKVTTFISETAPTAEGTGDLWFKASTGELRRWNGSAWGDALVDLTGVAVPSLDQVASVAFAADYLGVLSAGQLPKNINVTRRRGGVDVSSSTTWSIVSQVGITGTVTISSSGVVTIPTGATIGASSTIEVRSIRDGTTLDAHISVTRNDAPPPSTGSSGGTTVSDSTFNSVSGSSFVAISDLMTVKTGSSGQVQFAGALTTTVEAAPAVGYFHVEMKWQYRTVGGTFADVAAAVPSTTDAATLFEGYYYSEDGFIDCSPLKTGLSTGTDYEVQLFARRTSSSPLKDVFFLGTASAVGS